MLTAFPDDLDSLGYTPLMWGLLSSNFEYDTVRLLLEHGSRLDLMTGQGNTQLQIVILSNNLEYTSYNFYIILTKLILCFITGNGNVSNFCSNVDVM